MSQAGKINVATCQFSVGSSICQNADQIIQFMRKASEMDADIVHFSECALSGYVGTDFANFDGYDWQLLQAKTAEIISLAGELKLWVVLGSTHKLTKPNKPHNSLYLISSEGKLVDRYDKRFCTKGDLRRLSSGDHFVTFDLNGVKCSLLICFDLRFAELYRELYKASVKCVFQSFYNARQKGPSVHTKIMRQTMQCRAASNAMWVSMSNSSGNYSPYPSCFISPDGVIVNQLKNNKAGIMLNEIDMSKKFYDPMINFRELASKGILHNGLVPNDERSSNRKCF
jgi:predicted amidohydrolase